MLLKLDLVSAAERQDGWSDSNECYIRIQEGPYLRTYIYRFLKPAKNMADLLVQISYIFYQNVTKTDLLSVVRLVKIVAKKLVQKPRAFHILIYLKLTCNRTLLDEYFQTAKNVATRLA